MEIIIIINLDFEIQMNKQIPVTRPNLVDKKKKKIVNKQILLYYFADPEWKWKDW